MSSTQSSNLTPQRITVLGSTGSIGVNTLDVIARHPSRYQIYALTAHSNVEQLAAQCQTFQPKYAVMVDEAAAEQLRNQLLGQGSETDVLSGREALVTVASAAEVDCVMAAIVGAAGLLPTLSAVEQGKRILLANKESLVMTGSLFMDAVKKHGATLLPIDSEHNAIFQSMPNDRLDGLEQKGITKILLTGSGGPFRTEPIESLAAKTPDQACAHPNWDMGRKISVDSATMMNKGLEFIEACWMFSARTDQIEVVLHPQSVIHSMVEYVDGSVIAQLGNPDMRTPIAYGLSWPERIDAGVDFLDLVKTGQLTFETPNYDRFPCLRLAKEAMESGGTAPTVLNAANEIAVAAFLAERIKFTQIAEVIAKTLEGLSIVPAGSIETVVQQDQLAREFAESLL